MINQYPHNHNEFENNGTRTSNDTIIIIDLKPYDHIKVKVIKPFQSYNHLTIPFSKRFCIICNDKLIIYLIFESI